MRFSNCKLFAFFYETILKLNQKFNKNKPITAEEYIISCAECQLFERVFRHKFLFFYKFCGNKIDREGEKGVKKPLPDRAEVKKRNIYAASEASFFASFAFLFAALFLWRIPLVTAESIAETVSG